MKLFKIFLFLLLGFAAKTMRSQPHVYTANWCISFSNPDYVPTISDMSFIAQPANWPTMGRWKMIPGTSISYSPNMNSMKMWADTLCSIINRKCNPSYYITPATLSAYIQAECIIKDMSEGGISYRNYNAQLRTGIFGYEENSTFSRGTMGIADKNSGICFMKVSNKACANPNDPNLPEIKSYTPQPLPVPVPVPVPQAAPAVVVPQAPAPVPAVVPDAIPAPDADIPALENHSAPQAGNTYITNNYYYGNQQSDDDVIYADRQDVYYRHPTSNYYGSPDYGPYNPYYRSYPQRPSLYFGVSFSNQRTVQPNVQPPSPAPGGRPFDPGTAPGGRPFDPSTNSNGRSLDPGTGPTGRPYDPTH